ncbi:MAG: hypothetical protein R2932_52065 [Caldilineaceae bacterium]
MGTNLWLAVTGVATLCLCTPVGGAVATVIKLRRSSMNVKKVLAADHRCRAQDCGAATLLLVAAADLIDDPEPRNS